MFLNDLKIALCLGIFSGLLLGSAPTQAAASNSGSADKLFQFYQKHFSSEDGAVCPQYPTCSLYALQAIRGHGWFFGPLLAIDRLLGEYPGMARSEIYPLITKNGIDRAFDPVPESIF